MLLSDEINEKGVEIYFKYEYLNIETITRLFGRIINLHDVILNATSPVYYNEITQERFRNILDLTEITTGESIKIKFNEKWKWELPFHSGFVEGKLPKKLGVAAIASLLILVAAKQSFGVYNEYLDSQIKTLEKELRQNELYMQIEENRRHKYGPDSTRLQAKRTLDYIYRNDDITYFEINKIKIKERRDKRR